MGSDSNEPKSLAEEEPYLPAQIEHMATKGIRGGWLRESERRWLATVLRRDARIAGLEYDLQAQLDRHPHDPHDQLGALYDEIRAERDEARAEIAALRTENLASSIGETGWEELAHRAALQLAPEADALDTLRRIAELAEERPSKLMLAAINASGEGESVLQENARLRERVEALEALICSEEDVRDGDCHGCSLPNPEPCNERPKTEWCWPCLARAALRGEAG